LKKTAILLDEFTRIGGGQAVGLSMIESLSDKFRFDLLTDRKHQMVKSNIFERIFETSYDYYEGINRIKLIWKIGHLHKELEKLESMIRSHDLSINNHPNIFIFDASINVIHEFILRESVTSDGKFKRNLLSELIRRSGTYSVYKNSNLLFPGNFVAENNIDQFAYLGLTPKCKVINFPVNFPQTLEMNNKKPIILTFGRINPDKELDRVLDIARITDHRFIIAGAVNIGSEDYYDHLRDTKPENVELIRDPSEEDKLKLFTQSKLYLHTRNYEIYGLSVAEAIGHGCVPVVPRNGGPWIDIVCKGKYGFGYDTVEEASEIIKNLVSEKNSMAREIYDSRVRFSFDIFKEKFTEYALEISGLS